MDERDENNEGRNEGDENSGKGESDEASLQMLVGAQRHSIDPVGSNPSFLNLRHQASLTIVSIVWTESCLDHCRSPIARSSSLIRMEDSYAHMRESTESLSASSLSLLLQVLRQLCESLRFIANSVLFRRSGCTLCCIALSPRVSIVLTQYTFSISLRSYKRTS
jgi:hypothetical protein